MESTSPVQTIGFNTWAREEPNLTRASIPETVDVSILGLARSPTKAATSSFWRIAFQYLGSRGAQPSSSAASRPFRTFQYLGSRGAQLTMHHRFICAIKFQYLGSRGAQQKPHQNILQQHHVSILGLARSPTFRAFTSTSRGCWFQYLGSRGAQLSHGRG